LRAAPDSRFQGFHAGALVKITDADHIEIVDLPIKKGDVP
jgi:hypothetical protein